MVESAVKTAKRFLRKNMDANSNQYMALLDHRNTSTPGLDSCPVQQFMRRRTRTLIPTSAELLEPQVVNGTKRQRQWVEKQGWYHNTGAKPLPQLKVGDVVRMKPFKLVIRNRKKQLLQKCSVVDHIILRQMDKHIHRACWLTKNAGKKWKMSLGQVQFQRKPMVIVKKSKIQSTIIWIKDRNEKEMNSQVAIRNRCDNAQGEKFDRFTT